MILRMKSKPSSCWPVHVPAETTLRAWASSEWVEYQAWLFQHSFLTQQEWQRLHEAALSWQHCPIISLATPVYNTSLAHLQDCVQSVLIQAYPHWQLCLVNDGSDKPETVAYLAALADTDPRIYIHHAPTNQGICHATNQAIAMAYGDYVAFLDHDDRLSPDALFHVAALLRASPDTDIVYSDRDMLSPREQRFMHLFKPAWSPETLLSGNYLFHLTVYRLRLLRQLGGLRPELEGSQDFDLMLRATDAARVVQHIPKVLYHWRQHTESVALAHDAKTYIYTSGVQALQETLQRRGLAGRVTENHQLWRGQYRVQLAPLAADRYQIVPIQADQPYAQQVQAAFAKYQQRSLAGLVLLGDTVTALDESAIAELVSWLNIPAVGLVTGKLLDTAGQLYYAGWVHRPNGIPLAIYQGCDESTPGYMAVTSIVRNLSAPHPDCVVIRRSVWQQLGGFDNQYTGHYALLDFSLRALQQGSRIVYTPFARFKAQDLSAPTDWAALERQRFVQNWHTWLQQGDPYYNPHLTLRLQDMGLRAGVDEDVAG